MSNGLKASTGQTNSFEYNEETKKLELCEVGSGLDIHIHIRESAARM